MLITFFFFNGKQREKFSIKYYKSPYDILYVILLKLYSNFVKNRTKTVFSDKCC